MGKRGDSSRDALDGDVAHNFTLVLSGVRELDDHLETAVFEAGCDDAVLGIRNGVGFLEFDRLARSLPEAVLSAISDVETIDGVDVARVEPDDLVTASEIARRVGRTRESIRQLAQGERGPGGFPAPEHSLRSQSPLWRWAQVAEWFESTFAEGGIRSLDWENAAFIAVLNSALHMHRHVPTVSTMNALWSTMSAWHTTRNAPRYSWIRLVREAGTFD
ncbi:MAG: helix-turn-helix transcriptional regulator [Planctomycetota bacterium]